LDLTLGGPSICLAICWQPGHRKKSPLQQKWFEFGALEVYFTRFFSRYGLGNSAIFTHTHMHFLYKNYEHAHLSEHFYKFMVK